MRVDETDVEVEGGLVDLGEDDAPEPTVYEIGYHLLPTIAESDLTAAVNTITEALKAEKADFIGERFPSNITLAYPIGKRINEKRVTFDSAYFGWIAFAVPPSSIARIKAFFDGSASILRYLIVRTDREAVAAAMTGAIATPTGDIGKPKRDAETGGELSEAALDVALQTIVKEDEKASE